VEQLQQIPRVTIGTNGTSTCTGDLHWYDGTSIAFRRYDQWGKAMHGAGFKYYDITVTVAPTAQITVERIDDNAPLLTRWPTSATTRVLVAPVVAYQHDPHSDRMWD